MRTWHSRVHSLLSACTRFPTQSILRLRTDVFPSRACYTREVQQHLQPRTFFRPPFAAVNTSMLSSPIMVHSFRASRCHLRTTYASRSSLLYFSLPRFPRRVERARLPRRTAFFCLSLLSNQGHTPINTRSPPELSSSPTYRFLAATALSHAPFFFNHCNRRGQTRSVQAPGFVSTVPCSLDLLLPGCETDG